MSRDYAEIAKPTFLAGVVSYGGNPLWVGAFLALTVAGCAHAPAGLPVSQVAQSQATTSGTVAIVADAARPGPAFTRDQLGANMLVSVPESGEPQYLPLLKGAGIRFLRWPGGDAADQYQWSTNAWSSCSPYLKYPPRKDDAFDLWMSKIAKPLGADVAITVNYGSNADCSSGGDPAVAAAWVDHANNAMHDGIHYWTVGNEQYFENTNKWPGAHDGATYARRVANLFYPMMKAKDPSIQVGIDLAFGNATYDEENDPWDAAALRIAKYDFVEMHYYPFYNNLDNDDTLLTTWSDQIAKNFAGARKLLAKHGHAGAPIFLGEFDRDSGGADGDGHASVSIVNALFTATLIGEVAKAGVTMSSAWLAFGDCNADPPHVSNSYGWQRFGTFDMFSASPPGYDFSSCAAFGFPRMTPFPKGRAYQVATRFVTPGDRIVQTSSSSPSVRAYGATKKGGYALMLVNVRETASQTASVRIAHTPSTSFAATATFYDKTIYDRSKNDVWDGASTTQLGHVGNPFVLKLPPWSITVIELH
jgi:hypothetical protein